MGVGKLRFPGIRNVKDYKYEVLNKKLCFKRYQLCDTIISRNWSYQMTIRPKLGE